MKAACESTIVITLVTFLTLGQSTNAQEAAAIGAFEYPRTLQEQTVDPSPEAVAMMRYHDCPVSYATGTVDVNIPLLEWQTGSIPMSLSLSYHTGGIKVYEESGSIGLGWSLQGLGRVSRQICGMPDETKEFIQFGEGSVVTVKDMQDLLFYNKEANFDRYNYDFPGYSGSFFIDGTQIVHLTQNGVTIERIADSNNIKATDRFIITTPDGMVYTFADKEYCEHKNFVCEGAYQLYDLSYNATVVWNLTGISKSGTNDGVAIEYSKSDAYKRERYFGVKTLQRIWSWKPEMDCFIEPNGTGSQALTIFHGRSLPSKIICRNASVDFEIADLSTNNFYIDTRHIRSISIKNSNGKEIKKVVLNNNQTFEDNRLRLDGLNIISDNEVIDSRSFTYYPGFSQSYSDFFGYANGVKRLEYEDNILDKGTLELNEKRKTNDGNIKAWSLKTITEATGAVTEFSYKPSVWKAKTTDVNQRLKEVTDGLVIDCITTTDSLTGRKRVRTFKYDSPTMSIDLRALNKNDFISLSGVKTYIDYDYGANRDFEEAYSVYALNATLTAFCRRPGASAENMTIYYDKVTETITGTGINNPIKTEYYFDNTHCIHPTVSGSAKPQNAPILRTTNTDFEKTCNFSMHLGTNIPYSPNVANAKNNYTYEYLRLLFGEKFTECYFAERASLQPLLIKKISYDCQDGVYKPYETTEKFYSTPHSESFRIGFYCQSNVYRIKKYNGDYIYAFNEYGDIDNQQTWIISERLQLDSTRVTRHYPDGNSRTVSQHHYYSKAPMTNKFSWADRDKVLRNRIDSLVFPGNSLLPVTTLTRHRDELVGQTLIRAEAVKTPFHSETANRKQGLLPVCEKWFVAGGYNDTDSLSISYEYARFYDLYTNPTRIRLMHGTDNVISAQSFKRYDSYGHLTDFIDSDGVEKYFSWDNTNDLLSVQTKLSGSSQLSTRYTYIPLTGCSSATFPSGRKRNYSYNAGRLSAEINTNGKTIASYGYSLAVNKGYNSTQTTTYGESGPITDKTFYDGFGMPIQEVMVSAGYDGAHDVVTATEYDALDRPVKHWLPFPVSETDEPLTDAQINNAAAVTYPDNRPYDAVTYLGNASEDISAVYSPGEDMLAYPARNEYLCNNSTMKLSVRKYSVSEDRRQISYTGDYPAGSLDASVTYDPDKHLLITFTDWRGNKILERRQDDSGEYLDTYFINDCWGNQLVVLSPEASVRLGSKGRSWTTDTDGTIREYAFVYNYDSKLRLCYKKLPGCEPVRMLYDDFGRMAYMQDGNMRDNGIAMFTLYDKASRPVVTGLCDGEVMDFKTVSPMEAVFNPNKSGILSTAYVVSPTVLLPSPSLLTANYYDSYNFLKLDYFANLKDAETSNQHCNGLLTGSLSAVLGDNNSDPIASAYYYDTEDREVKRVSSSYYTYYSTTVITDYTIDGQPKSVSELLYSEGEKLFDTRSVYYYDSRGRLSRSMTYSKGLPDARVVTTRQIYNNIGQVSSAVADGIETAYRYDLRGNTKMTHNDYSHFDITYNKNGTIADYNKTGYGNRSFVYDGLDRLTADICSGGSTAHGAFTSTYKYDRNSNITRLTRLGYPFSGSNQCGYVDDLKMSYRGNQLMRTVDYADEVLSETSYDFYDGYDYDIEYTYDSNGNLTSDLNRGIESIEYNILNLPQKIRFNDGRWIDNIYDAAGRKLYTVLAFLKGTTSWGNGSGLIPVATVTLDSRNYVGNYEFVKDELARINTPDGYYDADGCFNTYLFDYQGNVDKVICNRNGKRSEVQSNSYYAYGLPTTDTEGGDNTYRYGGKEFDTRQGINFYDFKARTYAPDLCRFLQPDPKAGDYQWLSPYSYCAADPINRIDPDGKDIYEFDYNGNFMSVTREYGYDMIRIINELNKTSDYIFEYRTIQEMKNIDSNSYYFKVSGTQNSEAIFLILSSCINKEWSLIQAENINTGTTEIYIGTSKSDRFEGVSDYITNIILTPDKFNLKLSWHSHPDGSLPSGFPDDPREINRDRGDIPLAKIISDRYGGFNNFGVYNPNKEKIIKYTPYSKYTDFHK